MWQIEIQNIYTIRNSINKTIKTIQTTYILAYKAYDTEPMKKKCINEKVNVFDKIPLKTRAKQDITD